MTAVAWFFLLVIRGVPTVQVGPVATLEECNRQRVSALAAARTVYEEYPLNYLQTADCFVGATKGRARRGENDADVE